MVLDTAISEEQGVGEAEKSDELEEGEEVEEAGEVETEYHDGVYVTYVIYSDPIRISDLYDIQTTGTPIPPDTEVIIDSTDSTSSLVDDVGDEEIPPSEPSDIPVTDDGDENLNTALSDEANNQILSDEVVSFMTSPDEETSVVSDTTSYVDIGDGETEATDLP